MTVHTFPAGTSNWSDPAFDAFFDKTDSRGWIIRPGDTVRLPPASTATVILDNHKNLWNKGILEALPASSSVVHWLKFQNIDQTKFVSSQKKACTQATVAGNVVTYTVSPNQDDIIWPGVTSHNFEVGDSFVASAEFFEVRYRGTFIVTARTATTISCINAVPPTATATIRGTIRATGVITNDIGIWTTTDGRLNLQGTPKTAWTRAAMTIPASYAGAITCEDTVAGWQVNDVVYVVPTGVNEDKDEIAGMVVASVSGSSVTFNSPMPARQYERITIPANTRAGMAGPARHFGAELLNVTRNVRISGELPSFAGDPVHGRLHMATMDLTTTQTDTFNYVELFNVGPPGVGRWAFHYHKIGAAREGTVCEGIVARNGGPNSHTYVQHASDGITLKDCIAFNVDGAAYWWDLETAADLPNTGTWDHCAAVHITSIMKNDYRMSGMSNGPIGQDQGFTMRDCVVACVEDAGIQMNGFGWPEEGFPLNGWNIEGENVSHNNGTGLFTWWNTSSTFGKHGLDGFVLYRNYKRGFHIGAYNNSFRTDHAVLYQNGTHLGVPDKDQNHLAQFEALSSPNSDFEGHEGRNQYFFINGGGRALPIMEAAESVNGGPVRLHDAEIVNVAPPFFVHANSSATGSPQTNIRSLELIRCAITPTSTGVRRDIVPSDIVVDHVEAGDSTRCQALDDQSSWRIDYPIKGDGTGKIIQTGLAPFASRVTTQSLPNATQGVAYSQPLAAVATTPQTWSLVDGTTLPTGLTLSTAGVISGNPTTPGNYSFTVQVTGRNGIDAPKALTLNVVSTAALSISTPSLPDGSIGDVYSKTLAAIGGSTPYTWSVFAGALPTGLGLSSAGIISGTPTAAAGDYQVTIRVTDSLGATATKAYTLTVVDQRPFISTVSINPSEAGIAFSQTILASSGTAPYTFANILGPLPTGMNLSSAGLLNGTPTTAGSYPVRFRVTDSLGRQGPGHDYTIVVAAPLVFTPPALPDGTAGLAYFVDLNASNGVQPYDFRVQVTGGQLPPGLIINLATGVISGTPTTAGVFQFTVRAADALSAFVLKDLVITVAAAVIPVDVTRQQQRAFIMRARGYPSRVRSRFPV